jgi:protein-tyrosine phosphatase
MTERAAGLIEPYRIATIEAPRGGRIGISRMPGRSGDLVRDVDAIAAWRPVVVVSMTTAEEMQLLGAGRLADLLAGCGIEWRHFPVADYGVPSGEHAAWRTLASALHGALDHGALDHGALDHGALDRHDGVLLHCAGGKGRSGMVAMRLLVERGMEPAAALATVRAARPGAVETDAQERWARAAAS